MPTTPARARKWLTSGKAIKHWSDCGQFYVQLTVEPSDTTTQAIVVGIDPGKLYSGIGVQSSLFTLYTAHLVLPFKTVRERVDTRRMMRRARRGRRINRRIPFNQCAHRQKRFSNRRQDKLAPSIRANRQLELRIVSELCRLYPVSEIRYEYIRADVDLTSRRKAAKSGKGFSAVMVGQKWMLKQLEALAPVVKVEGWETASIRKHLGLVKNKADKSKAEFNTHAVDGVAIAASHFVRYRQYQGKTESGANWFGQVCITQAPFFNIKRPPISRRQLHLLVAAKGGERRKYGGSPTPFGIRKGDIVKYKDTIGYCSGYTGKSLSVSDVNWKRLGRYATSKVELVSRSNHLLVKFSASNGIQLALLSPSPLKRSVSTGSTSEV